ncbi:hypothetical protein MMC16_005278 [Acarospora aff. strigata]|nr:hypothetical protein [Acarospora aff. strigata]
MASSWTHIAEPFRFCDLPAEVRNKVYRLLLVKHNDITTPPGEPDLFCGCDDDPCICPIPLDDGEPGLQPAILLTNHQICGEATTILYGENCFEVNIGTGWIADFQGQPFQDPKHNGFDSHVHFSEVRKLNARVCVSMIDNVRDDKDCIVRMRAAVLKFSRILARREPLEVLKLTFMYGRPSLADGKVYELVFGPFRMLQGIGCVEAELELYLSLTKTLMALAEKDIPIVPIIDVDRLVELWEILEQNPGRNAEKLRMLRTLLGDDGDVSDEDMCWGTTDDDDDSDNP